MAFIEIKTFSETLRTKTDIQVILPSPLAGDLLPGVKKPFPYYSGELRPPVLYLLHGTYGDEGDWMRFSRIESYAQNYNLAIVMPEAGNSWYKNMPNGGPAYYDYITGELPRMIKWMFPVSDKREDTFIAGLSMGGSGAFSIAMSRPEQYSHAAVLSGALGDLDELLADGKSPWSLAFEPGQSVKNTKEDPFWLAEQVIKNKVDYPALYLCCGTEDFLYPANCTFREHLDKIGFKYRYHEQKGIHDFNFWDDEIQRVLDWLPIKKRSE
jgi:S-formylglutathione hydrolase FrmB